MFTYQPTVNDRSGEILAGAQTRSAEIKAAGQQALADGIARGATSAIGGALGAMTKTNTSDAITDSKGHGVPGLGASIDAARANAIKYDTAAGMLDAYKSNANDLGLSMDMLDGLSAKYSKDPDKLIGALTVVGRMAENQMAVNRSKQISDVQTANQKDVLDKRAALMGAYPKQNATPQFGVSVSPGIDMSR